MEYLQQYLRKDYAKTLLVTKQGVPIHNSCISHCLAHALGNCNYSHPNICKECENLFEFFDQLQKKLDIKQHEFLIDYQNRLVAFIAHHARRTYLNAQLTAELESLDHNGALILVDFKMRINPQSARETKEDFFGKRGW